MDGTPFVLALSAGVLAAVNPCGFAMLPAYVSLLVTGDTTAERRPSWPARLVRALALTAAMTLGFAAFFGMFGLLTAPVADWLAMRLPWLTVVIGAGLLGLGLWLLAGKDLPSPVPKIGSAPRLRQRFWPMFGFGVSFAVASLGCTIGPFLAVVVAGLTTESVAASAGLFLAYAGGMALVVGTVAVAVAAAQHSIIQRMRRAARFISRTAGAFMAVAGAYVAWFGWYEIRLLDGGITSDPVIDAAARVQTWLADTLSRIGAGGLAIAVALVLILSALTAWAHQRRRAAETGAHSSDANM